MMYYFTMETDHNGCSAVNILASKSRSIYAEMIIPDGLSQAEAEAYGFLDLKDAILSRDPDATFDDDYPETWPCARIGRQVDLLSYEL